MVFGSRLSLIPSIYLLYLIALFSVSKLQGQSFNSKSYQLHNSFFNVYENNEKLLLEVPVSLLKTPFLAVTRIPGYVQTVFNYGSNGMQPNEALLVYWEVINKDLVLRLISKRVTSEVTKLNNSIRNNYTDPIIAAYPIIERQNKNESIFVDFTKFYESDELIFNPISSTSRTRLSITGIDSQLSYLKQVKAYDSNIEFRYYITYRGDTLPHSEVTQHLTLGLNLSFIQLSSAPMRTRYANERIGTFTSDYLKYSPDRPFVSTIKKVNKWRLEPSDSNDYRNGKLVSPIKPIKIYMDPATPDKWKKYIIQGILAWNKVFESIGFKDAIVVENSIDSSGWDYENSSISLFRWVTSEVKDAQGDILVNPLSGEIIRANLIWYHNYFDHINSHYFILASAVDPRARTMVLPDEVFGEIMTETMTHEMGHALGLYHNMTSSSSYPTDSLRSPSFTKKMSLAPSVMDYANYNYIAQPRDTGVRFIRGLGPYDYWAVKHIYTPLFSDEKDSVYQVHVYEESDSLLYRYYEQVSPIIDPTNMPGDLGDDPILSGIYALKNFKIVSKNLVRWSGNSNDGNNTKVLRSRYDELFVQTDRIFRNAAYIIGGVYLSNKNNNKALTNFIPITKNKQEEALVFITDNLFNSPIWLINQDLLSLIGDVDVIRKINTIQVNTLTRILNTSKLNHITNEELLNPGISLDLNTILSSITESIYGKDKANDKIELQLQKSYLDRLKEVRNDERLLEGARREINKQIEGIASMKAY